MNNIEAELRILITKEEYDRLLTFFKKNADFIKEDDQETFYLDCKEDLRIQRNSYGSKIWLKKGKIHDEIKEEIEIKLESDDFRKLEKLFSNLGYGIAIKWYRNRLKFNWSGITICLDKTKGYGYILELEKMCSKDEQEIELAILKEKLKSLNVELTPTEEFDKKFEYYKQNWRELIK
jgi:predicted adenylyl cyclase CyaB